MKIRKAKLEDSRAISQVIRESINKIDYTYTKKQRDAWKYINRISQIKTWGERHEVFVVIEDEKIIAVGCLRNSKISRFFVSPNFQGKGIGRKFIEFLEKIAGKKGFSIVNLESVPSALGFYKKMGYKAKETIFPKYEGVEFKEIKMEKRI
jgi:GNAT superfamily N-acetyltransferase